MVRKSSLSTVDQESLHPIPSEAGRSRAPGPGADRQQRNRKPAQLHRNFFMIASGAVPKGDTGRAYHERQAGESSATPDPTLLPAGIYARVVLAQ
jgi:hypothetical protein